MLGRVNVGGGSGTQVYVDGELSSSKTIECTKMATASQLTDKLGGGNRATEMIRSCNGNVYKLTTSDSVNFPLYKIINGIWTQIANMKFASSSDYIPAVTQSAFAIDENEEYIYYLNQLYMLGSSSSYYNFIKYDLINNTYTVLLTKLSNKGYQATNVKGNVCTNIFVQNNTLHFLGYKNTHRGGTSEALNMYDSVVNTDGTISDESIIRSHRVASSYSFNDDGFMLSTPFAKFKNEIYVTMGFYYYNGNNETYTYYLYTYVKDLINNTWKGISKIATITFTYVSYPEIREMLYNENKNGFTIAGYDGTNYPIIYEYDCANKLLTTLAKIEKNAQMYRCAFWYDGFNYALYDETQMSMIYTPYMVNFK